MAGHLVSNILDGTRSSCQPLANSRLGDVSSEQEPSPFRFRVSPLHRSGDSVCSLVVLWDSLQTGCRRIGVLPAQGENSNLLQRCVDKRLTLKIATNACIRFCSD